MLPDEAIQEFKEIYFKKYRKRLKDEEVRELANNFYRVMKTIYKPTKKGTTKLKVNE